MSARHSVVTRQTRSLVGLAVRLSLEDEGRCKKMDELIDDAFALHSAALNARFAIAKGRSPRVAYAKAQKVAERYEARVVVNDDVNGMVLGLRFTSGRYGSVYPVS